MTEAELIRRYYQKIVEQNFKNSGEIENPDVSIKAVDTKGCHGNDTNILYFYFRVEKNIVKEIKYNCGYCDVIMYVTAEIMCNLIKDISIEKISKITKDDFINELGGYSQKTGIRWKTALNMLCKEIKKCLLSAPMIILFW